MYEELSRAAEAAEESHQTLEKRRGALLLSLSNAQEATLKRTEGNSRESIMSSQLRPSARHGSSTPKRRHPLPSSKGF